MCTCKMLRKKSAPTTCMPSQNQTCTHLYRTVLYLKKFSSKTWGINQLDNQTCTHLLLFCIIAVFFCTTFAVLNNFAGLFCTSFAVLYNFAVLFFLRVAVLHHCCFFLHQFCCSVKFCCFVLHQCQYTTSLLFWNTLLLIY